MISRSHMPQIPKDSTDEFVEFLREHGIHVEMRRISGALLRPLQKHVNREKVDKFKQDQSALSIPLIISKTGYILDGHHRWIARRELDPQAKMVCIWCKCPIKQLFELGHDFEHSFSKGVNEQLRLRTVVSSLAGQSV